MTDQRTSSDLPAPYPKREPYFAHRFLRTLTKAAAGMDLGPDACWLLTIVVMQEDVCRYRRPVTFWNERLCDLVGWSDDRTLVRTRSMLVGSGWLHYQAAPIGTRKPGAYYVCIPDDAEGMDAPVEEGPRPTLDVGRGGGRDVGRHGGRSVGRDVGRPGGRDGGLSTLIPIPTPIPTPAAPASPPSSGKPTTPTTAALVRVDGIDRPEVQRSIADGSLNRLIQAYGCTWSKDLKREWHREASGLVLHTMAVILAWRVAQRDPVRLPSGLAQARELWRSLPESDKRILTTDILADLGVPCPAMRAAS